MHRGVQAEGSAGRGRETTSERHDSGCEAAEWWVALVIGKVSAIVDEAIFRDIKILVEGISSKLNHTSEFSAILITYRISFIRS